nr:unnamed protein product [Callosobruchus analis]
MDHANSGSTTTKSISHGDKQKRFTCNVCNSKYTMKKTLLRHLKSKHPQHLTVVYQVVTDPDQLPYKCFECGLQFALRASLLKHCSRKKHEKPSLPSTRNGHRKFICHHCNTSFSIKPNLAKHIYKYHILKKPYKMDNFCCSICNCAFKTYSDLCSHFSSHNIEIQRQQYIFDNFLQFLEWKKQEENCTFYRYVKRCSTKISKVGEKRATYYCHRSGTFKSRSKGHRKIKKQGTKKIGKDCPARMYVKVSTTGEVFIDYVQTHVGHDNDEIFHCTLTDRKNSTTSEKVPTVGLCYNEIVKEVKNSESFDPKARDTANNKDQAITDKSFHIVSTKVAEIENQELWVTEEPSKTPELSVAAPETFVESKIHFINDLVQLVNDNINSPEELVEATKLAKPLLDRLREAAKKKGAATNVSVPKMDIVEFQTIHTPTSIQIIHAAPAQVIETQSVQLQHIHLMETTQVLHSLAQVTHLATHGTSSIEQESLSLPLIKLDSIFQAV